MEYLSEAKSARLLAIYSRLVNGEILKRQIWLGNTYHRAECTA